MSFANSESELRGNAELLTYVDPDAKRWKRWLVRSIENMLGRWRMVRQLEGLLGVQPEDMTFWAWALHNMKVDHKIASGSLDEVPRNGPLIFVANHPFGIADGLVMAEILAEVNEDFRVMTHAALCQLPQTEKNLVPIRFDSASDAVKENLRNCNDLADYAAAGGVVGLFPGGVVSTANRAFGKPYDPEWKNFAARMIAKSNATVVPLYFEGHNSRLFQIVSQFSVSLRNALFIFESRQMADTCVKVHIGKPIEASELEAFESRTEATAHLRRLVYRAGGDMNPDAYRTRIW